MLKIGLTGGIGSGKTTVSNLFAGYGIPIIDADIIAHQLVEPGEPALTKIREIFGNRVINPDSSLNRKELRTLVFTDPNNKTKLEAIIHPLVYQGIQSEVATLNSAYCIISIPLLIETHMTACVDKILVVDCSVDIQIARVKSRDNLSEKTILAIINSQASREIRNSQADDIINNSGANSQLAEQVKKLHNQYLSLDER